MVSLSAAVLAGGFLRFWMLRKFFEVNGDSQLYGDLAKNLLLHHRYAITDGSGLLHSTLIRLPGYPLFLAACFRIFGMENYFAPAVVQIVLELLGCVLLADCAARVRTARLRPTRPGTASWRPQAFHAALWLAALCPFTAIYAAEPLTEALSVFCIVLALWSLTHFLAAPRWRFALVFTVAVAYAALLRPDGALVGVALAPAMLLALFRCVRRGAALRMAAACLLLAATPFTLWTARNARVFHVFQPLAPRYATDPGENTWPGFQRWVKTWCLDFVSTYTTYWNVPGGPIDVDQLPARAFDSPAQRAVTAQLAADYKANGEELSPALDARFGQLADQRIAAHPLRTHVLLPLGRMLDMWFRPRVENLPIDLDWWNYAHHHQETRFSWFYAVLNVFYVVLGLVGMVVLIRMRQGPRLWPWMLLYMVLRSALLCTIEAPEARYTIECFPMLFLFGGIALGRLFAPRTRLSD